MHIFAISFFNNFPGEHAPIPSSPSTLDRWCLWNLTLCQQMDLRALVDLNCIATQVKRFQFLEKYTGRLHLISNLSIKSWNKRKILVQYCSKQNAQMTQQRLNLGLQKNLKTNHLQVQIFWVSLQICYSDLSQAKQ